MKLLSASLGDEADAEGEHEPRRANVGVLQFMSIADAVRVFGLSARAIRFYEGLGLFSAARNRSRGD